MMHRGAVFLGALCLGATPAVAGSCTTVKLSAARPVAGVTGSQVTSVLNLGPGAVVVRNDGFRLGVKEAEVLVGYAGRRITAALAKGSSAARVKFCRD